MTQQHLVRLWQVVGLVCTLYALNAWLVGQGASAVFDLVLIEKRKVGAQLVALVVVALLLMLTAQIGIIHARRSHHIAWHARQPLVWLEGLDTGSVEGRCYQAFWLVLLVLIPLAALVYFTHVVLDGEVAHVRQSSVEIIGPLDRVDASAFWRSLSGSHEFRLGDGPVGAERGVTWFPMIQPALLATLLLGALAQSLRLFRALFRHSP